MTAEELTGRLFGPAAVHRAAARCALPWAVGYAAFGVVGALTGTPLLRAGVLELPAGYDWAVAGVGAAAALCLVAVRRGARAAARAPLLVLCGLLGVAAFGLLMDLVVLLSGAPPDDWAAAQHVAAAAGVPLLLVAARSARPPAPPLAPAQADGPGDGREWIVAAAGTVAFVPYVAMKVWWASGGTYAGLSGAELREASRENGASGIWLALESRGIDGTVLLAGLGVLLLWALVRPWGRVFPGWVPGLGGRRVPRALPMVPAVIGAASLLPYGVIGLGYCTLATAGAITMRAGDFPSSGDALLAAWPGIGGFCGYGVALTVALRAYWLRTRPDATTS